MRTVAIVLALLAAPRAHAGQDCEAIKTKILDCRADTHADGCRTVPPLREQYQKCMSDAARYKAIDRDRREAEQREQQLQHETETRAAERDQQRVDDGERGAKVIAARKAADEAMQAERNEEFALAENLSAVDRIRLLTGIVCDADGQAAYALDEIKKEKAIGRTPGAVDLEVLHDQGATAEEQKARARRARQLLKRQATCRSAENQMLGECVRVHLGYGHRQDADCTIKDFWKYELAIQKLEN